MQDMALDNIQAQLWAARRFSVQAEFQCDHTGRNVQVNAAYASLMRVGEFDLLGYGWKNRVVEEDRRDYEIAAHQAFKEHRKFERTVRFQRGDGTRFRGRVRLEPQFTPEDLERSVTIDLELPSESVTFAMAKELQALEPFGAGNACPVFMTSNLRCLSEPVVLKDQHLRLRLAGPQNQPLEAIWFNCTEPGRQTPKLNGSIELAYTIELSGWNDEYRLQLNVVDARTVELSA
jgi:hypothetical protein